MTPKRTWLNDYQFGAWKGLLLARCCHVLVGTFAGRQPKPFGAFLTHNGRRLGNQSRALTYFVTEL
jgi:hypothetical protein